MPEPFPELNYGYSVVFTTPYILIDLDGKIGSSAKRADWEAFFDRNLKTTGEKDKIKAYETFMIHRGSKESDFCKTARKPYDVVVVASLAVAHKLGIITEWNSDGDKESGDFDDAMALLNKIGITEFK